MKTSRKSCLAANAVVVVLVVVGGCDRIENYPVPQSRHPVEIVETNEGFLITQGRQKILFYQRKPKALDGKYPRANYIHPLCGLDGEILTEDFPSDHPHHRGIFWAWHQIYVGDTRIGDGWSTQDIFWDVHNARILEVDSESRALQVDVLWKSPLWTDASGKQKPFVKETTTITVHCTQGDIRKIDFEICLLALEDGVRIGGADNEKEYGGFSARIRLPDGLCFTGQNGDVEPQSTPIEAGPWLDFSGRFGDDEDVSGLAILCRESNPGYPQKWVLRRKASMQNPVWPGRAPIQLSCEKPLILRYRLIIHRGNVHHVNLNRLQAEYKTQPH